MTEIVRFFKNELDLIDDLLKKVDQTAEASDRGKVLNDVLFNFMNLKPKFDELDSWPENYPKLEVPPDIIKQKADYLWKKFNYKWNKLFDQSAP